MIERPDTDCPSLNTVTSARNPPAHCTNLAAARACRPRLLVISSTRRAVIGAIPPPGGDTTRIRPPCPRSEPPRTSEEIEMYFRPASRPAKMGRAAGRGRVWQDGLDSVGAG